MLGPEKLKNIAHTVLAACRGAGAEVWIHSFDEGLTRFAENAIHQNVAESNVEVTLRANLDGRSGTATTNQLDNLSLRRLAEDAMAAAKLSPADPNDPGIAAPLEIEPARAFDEETAACSPAERAERANQVCRQSAAAGFSAAGAYSTAAIELCAANSNGLFAYHPYTSAEAQISIMGSDSAGRGQGAHWQMGQVDVEALGDQALRTAQQGANPRPIEPGEYPVILGPYAVQDIALGLSVYGASGLAVHEGRSWMGGREGKQAVSALVSLWDDGRDPGSIALPFDGEGQPRQRVEIIRAGVVGEALYDRATARKTGCPATGHALPPAMRSMGPMPSNLVIASGTSSLEEMISTTRAGLLITRFWYTRLVSARDCVLTGMTRDGVFWIENGAVAYPVKDVRFTQSYVQALAEVSAVGSEAPLQKAQYGEIYTRVPALKMERFRFTS